MPNCAGREGGFKAESTKSPRARRENRDKTETRRAAVHPAQTTPGLRLPGLWRTWYRFLPNAATTATISNFVSSFDSGFASAQDDTTLRLCRWWRTRYTIIIYTKRFVSERPGPCCCGRPCRGRGGRRGFVTAGCRGERKGWKKNVKKFLRSWGTKAIAPPS